jgi:hypothetical protein
MKKHKNVFFWICVILKFFFPTLYSQEDSNYLIYQFASHLFLIQLLLN